MNQKLNDYKEYIKSKKVAVIGLGISNTPLVKYLSGLNVDIAVFDSANESDIKDKMELFKGYNIKFYLGKDYLDHLKGFDVIFKTPIVRYDIPQLIAEKENGAVITSEMEVFMDICPAKIFAVTGSDGKTTTTTLLYNVLKESGYKCWLGGNIGTPLLDKIDEIDENDKVILELSSFQLHTMNISANVSIITNLAPNHLDIHKSMDEYIDAKKNIFKFQDKDDIAIFNFDNEITRDLMDEAKSKVIPFSRVNKIDYGATVENNSIVFKQKEETVFIVKTDDILLPGVHNIENYLAVVAATFNYTKPEIINKVATTFSTVEHRIEFVRELKGIKFYNDSIGSSPSRTIASIKSFKNKVILIAGGYDKKIPYEPLSEVLVKKVKVLVLMGQTAPLIEKVLRDQLAKNPTLDIPIIKCSSLEEAVISAYNSAKADDTIILSPASASFDMFKNFEVRGRKFKDLVNSLTD